MNHRLQEIPFPSPSDSTCMTQTCNSQVQKSAEHYTEAAKDEVIILHQITDGDKDRQKPCVHLYDDFEHSGPHGRHVCMAFEVLAASLKSLEVTCLASFDLLAR